MRRHLSLLLTALIAAAPAAPVPAQEKRTGEVQATVEVVVLSLDVTVIDKKERPVLDLTRADFEVKVGGKVQPFEFFEPPSGARPAGPTPTGRPIEAPSPELIAGTTQPMQIDTKPRLRVLFYVDLEGLPQGSVRAAARSARAVLDATGGSPAISLVSHLGQASQVFWDESSLDRIDSELERIADGMGIGSERSVVADSISGPGSRVLAGDMRSWDSRHLLEQMIIQRVVDSDPRCMGNEQSLVQAMREADVYVATERLRVKDAVAELRKTCEQFAEGGGRRNVIFLGEGIERVPGQNFVELLRVARDTGCGRSLPSLGSSASPRSLSLSTPSGMPVTPLTDLTDLEKWLAASGVTIHFVNPIRGGDFASAESPSYEANRNFSGERRSLEDGVGPLVAATGGFFKSAGGEIGPRLATVLDAAQATYRIGVRLQNVRVDQPYKVAVSVKRKGLTVRHQSSFVPKAPQKSVSDAQVKAAERALAQARQDESRPGPARLALPPIGLTVAWKGKVHPDERKSGRNIYRVEVSVRYGDLKFLAQEDAMIANLRLTLKAEGTGTTTGGDEADLDVSPTFTGEEYRTARDQNLVRALLLSLPPGTYRLTATVADLAEERTGLARTEVIAEK